jgi:hypothetical protein
VSFLDHPVPAEAALTVIGLFFQTVIIKVYLFSCSHSPQCVMYGTQDVNCECTVCMTVQFSNTRILFWLDQNNLLVLTSLPIQLGGIANEIKKNSCSLQQALCCKM